MKKLIYKLIILIIFNIHKNNPKNQIKSNEYLNNTFDYEGIFNHLNSNKVMYSSLIIAFTTIFLFYFLKNNSKKKYKEIKPLAIKVQNSSGSELNQESQERDSSLISKKPLISEEKNRSKWCEILENIIKEENLKLTDQQEIREAKKLLKGQTGLEKKRERETKQIEKQKKRLEIKEEMAIIKSKQTQKKNKSLKLKNKSPSSQKTKIFLERNLNTSTLQEHLEKPLEIIKQQKENKKIQQLFYHQKKIIKSIIKLKENLAETTEKNDKLYINTTIKIHQLEIKKTILEIEIKKITTKNTCTEYFNNYMKLIKTKENEILILQSNLKSLENNIKKSEQIKKYHQNKINLPTSKKIEKFSLFKKLMNKVSSIF